MYQMVINVTVMTTYNDFTVIVTNGVKKKEREYETPLFLTA